MAQVTHSTPDDFESPQQRKAPSKSTVSTVISRFLAGGNALISLVTGILAAALILYSGYVLYDSFYTQNAAASSAIDLLQYRPEIIDDGATPLSGADTLSAINKDYRSWLTIYDSTIDYPVMQGKDDLYYASHDIYGKSSLTGAIYLAAANTANLSDTYNLIYGHHMDNGAMFGALDRFEDADYFREHREGILVSENGIYDLTAFAIIRTDAYESKVYTVGNRAEDVLSFLRAPGSNTNVVIFDEAVASEAERIVALSTCASADTNGRLVLFARMVPRAALTVTAIGYSGQYDAQTHYGSGEPNIQEGTTLTYSVDDGATWSLNPPSILNIGTVRFRVRAHNEDYGDATAYATLTVTPIPVTVKADPAQETFDSGDHNYTATVSGVIDDYQIQYVVENTLLNGNNQTNPSQLSAGEGAPVARFLGAERGLTASLLASGSSTLGVGYYAGVIVPSGESVQGNYTVTYYPADLEILPSPALAVEASGYEGVYDAAAHEVGVGTTDIIGETIIYYSTDGGETWTTDPTEILNVGEVEVLVKAENPNYYTAYDTATLTVTPRPAVVTAQPASKVYGSPDPSFTATESGVIDGYVLQYSVTRPGGEEDVGTYPDAIVPEGAALQGNYSVSYVPADFSITSTGGLTIDAEGYSGVYDGGSHGPSVTVNTPEGTTVEYSTDGGATWSTTPPTITDVGVVNVQIRATNPGQGTAQTSVTLQVTPATVTVTANDAVKSYGDPDPAFSASVSGLIGDDTISYTVSRSGNDENVGTYPGVIVPDGAERQGNYIVVYVPGTLRIDPAAQLTVTAESYSGVYDARDHAAGGSASVTEGTTIEYSVDGGETWSAVPPTIRNVGDQSFLVRATNPNYLPATASGTLRVTPAPVVVTAQDSGKVYGTADPGFTAVVTGLIDDQQIRYTLSRQGGNEAVGFYRNVIVPAGDALQGNYTVTYVPANFTITSGGILTLTATGYSGVYDAAEHTGSASVNVPDGTVIEYSIDGGVTWLTEMPNVINVGSVTVLVRATNPNYEPVTQTVVLTVTPAQVVVTAQAAEKLAGAVDPAFTASVSGVIDDYEIRYTVSRPGAGRDEEEGVYANAILPTGDTAQGNYTVRYVPADFTIRAGGENLVLTLTATGYEGVYDAREHAVTAQVSIREGTTLSFSIDGGATWTDTPPSIRDVGETEVLVRAENPAFETAQAAVMLRVTPRDVTVLANSAIKLVGQADPAFTATVSGVIDGFDIAYTLSRPGAGRDETAGTYPNAIVPAGEELQGNYRVHYIPANFVIADEPGAPVIPVTPVEPDEPGPEGPSGPDTPDEPGPEEPPTEEIEEPEVPLIQRVTEPFVPTPHIGYAAWALVNLICLIITIYLFIPLLHLKAKFGRARLMKKVNELLG